MLTVISKFVLNIFPSVAASVIGAYIVHNYITTKPAAPPPAAASALASKADDVAMGRGPSIMPIPVNGSAAELEAPADARERPASGLTPPTSVSTGTGGDKHAAAVHVRSAHALARSSRERFGVARRGGPSGEAAAPQRERLHAGAAAMAAVPAAGPILMPAVDMVPDAQAEELVSEARIDPASRATRADSGRFILPAEIPLLKRLAGFSNDVETALVSRTMSAADDIATAAKSAFRVVMPR